MLYVVFEKNRGKNLRYMISNLNAKFIEKSKLQWSIFNKKDILISDDDEITKVAKKHGITSIYLMKIGHYDKSSEMHYDFEFFYGKRFRKSAVSGINAVVLYKKGKLKATVRRGVANVILNKTHNKVLLLKRKAPGWGYSLVQGGIEKGESEIDALKRESYEESGTTYLKILKKIQIRNPYYLTRFKGTNAVDIRIGKYNLFITETKEENRITFNDLTAKKAFVSGGWFDIKKAYDMLPMARHKKYLEHAIAYLNK